MLGKIPITLSSSYRFPGMNSQSVWHFHGRIFGILVFICLGLTEGLFAKGFESCAKHEKGVGDVFVCGAQLCRKKRGLDPGQENWCSLDSFRSYRGQILDSQQQEFFIRGVNNPHVWFGKEALSALPSIASLGFNSIRVVWTLDKSQDELSTVLNRVLELKMIPILEFHDVTGRSDPWELLSLVDTMISRYAPILVGKEDRVLINIANEWGGNVLSHEAWRDTYHQAVKKLRDAGFHHLLIIDAAGWAQDPNSVLKYGQSIYETDPLQNVAFSLHLYEKWRTAYPYKFPITETFARLKQKELAVLIGEFAQQHDFHLDGSSTTICFDPIDPVAQEKYLAEVYKDGYRPTQYDFAIDFKKIMQEAHNFKMGYLAWSWRGNGRSNNCYLDYLDIANQWDVGSGSGFQPNKLNYWGCELVKNLQAQPASIFGQPDSGWSRYADLSCSPEGNFLSCDRFDGGYGSEFSCGNGRLCRKSTADTNQTDWAYWCAVDQ
jgi:mannan endo-1,4-beta-mannosidase